jgi:hypothetical protein
MVTYRQTTVFCKRLCSTNYFRVDLSATTRPTTPDEILGGLP